jgi:hypothetical protein
LQIGTETDRRGYVVNSAADDRDRRRLVQAPEVLLQDLAGEAVLLNLGNGQYYGLDEIGFHMYQLLVTSASLELAYQRLLDEYDVEPAQLALDLDEFVENLLRNGLVQHAGVGLDQA